MTRKEGPVMASRERLAMTRRRGLRMIRDLILKNRSYRQFYQGVDINLETLRELVDLARLSPSARNAQPLKYILSCKPQRNSLIFPTSGLGWVSQGLVRYL
jgi:nitroreductase